MPQRRLASVLLGSLLLLSPATAAAQVGSALEVGGFGRYTVLDRSLEFTNPIGVGALLAVYLREGVSLEGDLSYALTDGLAGARIAYVPMHARLVVHRAVRERTTLHLGLGWNHNEYGRDRAVSDDGVGALAGFRLALTRRLGLRIDGTVDYVPTPANQGAIDITNWHYGLQAGLTVLVGPLTPPDRDRDGIIDRHDRCLDSPPDEPVDPTGCSLPRDTDGDGVLDPIDRCPETPAGERVDGLGCPLDRDHDGVVNAQDRCPDTPAGTPVDAVGCPLPVDGDRDGVTDDRDRCPDTPPGTPVDPSGCTLPPQDSDGDGVTDDRDRCADTPRGVAVDGLGCRILFTERRSSLILEGVTFETGSSRLTDAAKAILLQVARSLQAYPEIRVEVAGHTDNTGSLTLNRRLSQERAESVREFLVRSGVTEGRLTARGYGPDRPVTSNATAAGRSQNRRVELQRLN